MGSFRVTFVSLLSVFQMSLSAFTELRYHKDNRDPNAASNLSAANFFLSKPVLYICLRFEKKKV